MIDDGFTSWDTFSFFFFKDFAKICGFAYFLNLFLNEYPGVVCTPYPLMRGVVSGGPFMVKWAS